ncbi:MAG: phosphoribosylglycinamide formyltransferase [Spirochaetales bacterium]|nr:phosphoribosylglycinamide formyltransferase [Spirochaetales bacterium]
MAGYAVLASGSGSNFEALVKTLAAGPHRCCVLIGDRAGAGCFERAERLGVPAVLVSYAKDADGKLDRLSAERTLTHTLEEYRAELVVLAGFMRVLSPFFVHRWKGRLINIHPSLLPRHPGAHAIRDSWESTDLELGVSVHWVDEGVDTGKLIEQASFSRSGIQSLAEAEEQIHRLEHQLYPRVVRRLLDELTPG